MRKLILAAAAALAAVAAPAVASAQTGYVGAVYNDIDSDLGDGEAYGLEGSVFFPAGSLGVEVDASVLDSDDTDESYGITGHLFTRSENYLFGGFVGFSDNDIDSTWSAGLEANKYYDRWTLNGAVGYAEGDDTDGEAYGVNVGASLFASDNLRFDGNVGWASVDSGAGDDDAMLFGVGAEYQFAAIPISLGATYAHVESDDTGAEGDIIGVAVRYNWGGTLLDRDRNGASQANRTGFLSAVL
jgi:hypothetical protein